MTAFVNEVEDIRAAYLVEILSGHVAILADRADFLQFMETCPLVGQQLRLAKALATQNAVAVRGVLLN